MDENIIEEMKVDNFKIYSCNVMVSLFRQQIGIKIIKELIEKNAIIGIQELRMDTLLELQSYLKDNCSLINGYRYNRFALYFDELNSIIAPNVVWSRTEKIAKLIDLERKKFTLQPRMLNQVKIEKDGNYYYSYNTHLGYTDYKEQRIQMENILKIIDENNARESLPFFLTGDFNCSPGNENIKFFQKELLKRGCKLIISEEETFKGKVYLEVETKILDYVAVPVGQDELAANNVEVQPGYENIVNNIETTIVNSGVIENENSDHNIACADVKIINRMNELKTENNMGRSR